MLKNAPIVILDEQRLLPILRMRNKLQKSIEELTKGKTLLVIAHRLSTITDADQIVVLKNGRIEAKGTQAQLLENCPLYERMWPGTCRSQTLGSWRSERRRTDMFKTVKRIIHWCGAFKKNLYIGFVFSFFSGWFAAMPVIWAAFLIGRLVESAGKRRKGQYSMGR